jgi:hypothetical protein
LHDSDIDFFQLLKRKSVLSPVMAVKATVGKLLVLEPTKMRLKTDRWKVQAGLTATQSSRVQNCHDKSDCRETWLAGTELAFELAYSKISQLAPTGVEIVYEQLILHEGVLNDVRGKLDFIVERAVRFTKAQEVDGLIFPGAPREVLNPGLFAALSQAVQVVEPRR